MPRSHTTSRIIGFSMLAAFLAALLAGPALAVPSNKAECRRMTRQIEHFEDVAGMAAQRGDEMWWDGTVQHIKQLAERRLRLCPEYAEPNYAKIYAEWAMWMARRAADAFITYTTFGAY